jgi:acetyltransferase-like isoleucine patch superfamily enzyme
MALRRIYGSRRPVRQPDASRVVPAVHAHRPIESDPAHEIALAAHLAGQPQEQLIELYDRFRGGSTGFDGMLRRVLWRALLKSAGDAIEIGAGVQFRHLETIELGHGVSIGDQVCLYGRHDGYCRIGSRVWIGAQAFIDARALEIEQEAGLGPGVRILGSEHTGEPVDEPVIRTDLRIRPIRICRGADIGVNAVILPGVTIGEGAVVGAGAVVRRDVPAYTVAMGDPARVARARKPS